jgi:hypothetical protein
MFNRSKVLLTYKTIEGNVFVSTFIFVWGWLSEKTPPTGLEKNNLVIPEEL